MSSTSTSDGSQPTTEFEELGHDRQLSLVEEFFAFVVTNKKWWLIPIALVLSAVAALVALGSTGAAPFIYTIF